MLFFVDDDEIYRTIVKAELIEEGFEVRDFKTGEEMLECLRAGHTAGIIILDWKVGKIDGIDLLPMIRELDAEVPIVFLTGRNSTVHERVALQRGAVDFIDKSRGTDILAARLRLLGHVKRKALQASQLFQCGPLTLKLDTGRAYWDGIDVDLTVTEFKVVHLIASHASEYVAYRKIYDAMHFVGFVSGTGNEGYRTNVRSSIKRIRDKFLKLDRSFDAIRNYAGFGYSWDRPAER
jgi:two-component system response regulator ChvI